MYCVRALANNEQAACTKFIGAQELDIGRAQAIDLVQADDADKHKSGEAHSGFL